MLRISRRSATVRSGSKPTVLRAGLAVLFLVLASCASGAGCGGCGGTIPGGFPRASVIQNAGAVRLTRSGLDQLASNLPAVVTKLLGSGSDTVQYPIPKTSGSIDLTVTNLNYTICSTGPDPGTTPPHCIAEIELGKTILHLDATTPNSVVVSGTIPVRMRDLPISSSVGGLDVSLGQNPQCSSGSADADFKAFPVTVSIPVVTETNPPRDGFAKLDLANATIDVGVTKNDVNVCSHCGALDFICSPVENFIKGLAFNTLKSGITDTLKSTLANALCTKADTTVTPACPTGTTNVNGTCRFGTKDTDACVTQELGIETKIDLGSALASISPGASGALDVAFAGAGTLQVTAPDGSAGKPADNTGYAGHTPNGLTLQMLGGALPQPQSSCVPAFTNVPPTGIPVPDELMKDGQTGWPTGDPLKGPNVGIAISGRFLNYAFGSAYNSGVLCLGITTDQIAQIQSGLISVLIPSIKNLTFEQAAASVAITTRPQVPPKVTLGTGKDVNTDPLLKVELDKFAVDFYIWSSDRYVRAFTFTADVTIPINLTTAKDPVKNPKGGLLPTLGNLVLANATVTNSQLLSDDPKTMASALSSIIGGLGGQLVGSISAIDLSNIAASFGLYIQIPDGGVRKISKGSDDFLAIFADLSNKPAATIQAKANVDIVQKVVHPEAMALSNASRDLLPELHLALSSPQEDSDHAVEYAWSIDQGTRSAWSQETNPVIKTDYLFYQGNHVLNVWSRIVGDMDSESAEPTKTPFRIDVLAPRGEITDGADGLHFDALDFVSPKSALVARTRTTINGNVAAYGEWAPVSTFDTMKVDPTASSIDVQVRDEEGNIGTVSSALIRGRTDSTLAAAGSGCGCSTPGTSTSGNGWMLVLTLGGVLGFGLRRRGSAKSGTKKVEKAARALRTGRLHTNHTALLGLGSIAFVAMTSQGCSCGGGGDATTGTGCGSDCNQVCEPSLDQGMVGAYTSVAKATDGTIWVAGYNDAALGDQGAFLYGDLVVGKYDATGNQVAWQTVDGLPPARTDGTCPDNDPKGWRNGEADAGDDVGLWTSIQVNGSDRPMVAYYDATNHALKFAAAFDSDTFGTYTLAGAQPGGQPPEPGMDAGRYAKMAVVNGNPVVAYSVVETGKDGFARSKVVLATASSATPHDATGWTFEDLYVDEKSPCRASTCSTGQVCVKSTGQCQATVGGCTPTDCGTGNACVTVAAAATCEAVIDASHIESYPNIASDYVSLANGPNGLGVVAYDRIHGNLLGIAKTGGAWTAQILDGETGSRSANTALDTGDDGVGASLTITSNGDWHVSYVNGITETLHYLKVPGGTKPLASEVVDDGQSLGTGTPAFDDGTHIVGDDSRVVVDDSGNVTIYYQDATAGQLRVATGAVTGATHKWTLKQVAQPNKFAGFFPQPIPGGNQVANWWRATDPVTKSISGNVAILTP